MKFILHTFYSKNPLECSLEKILEQVPNGWVNILTKGFEEMFRLGWDGEIRQIKEKFGSLRLYVHNTSKEVREIINRMEEETENVCSVCGNPATKTSSGWFLHFCEEHFPEQK